MYISNSEIRAKARAALGNNIFDKSWLLTTLAIFIVSLILSLVSQMSCGIGTMLLTGPLYVGLYAAFLKLTRKEDEFKISNIFEGCDNFGSNLSLGVMHSLMIALWSLLFIIPGIMKSYSYAMCYYVKADHPEYGWRECLDESERLMKGNRMKFFWLQLSFTGWAILGYLTCGIGVMWVSSYMVTANAVFYDELKRADGSSYKTYDYTEV